MNLAELHPLVAGVADEPWARGDYAGAVEAAWFALRDMLRYKLDSPLDGVKLINEIGEGEPKLLLTDFVTETDRSMHRGIMHLLRGVASYVRNPAAHDAGPPEGQSPARCFEYLATISICARHVVDAIQPTTVEEIVREASQRRFAPTPEAAKDLIDALPPALRPGLVEALASAYKVAMDDEASALAKSLLMVYRVALSDIRGDTLTVRKAARVCARLLAHDSTFNVGVDLLTLQVFLALPARYRVHVVQAIHEDAMAGKAARGRLLEGGRFFDPLFLVFEGFVPRDRAILLRILSQSVLASGERAAFALRVLGPLSRLLRHDEFGTPASACAGAVLACERGDEVYEEALKLAKSCAPAFADALVRELQAGVEPDELDAVGYDPTAVSRIRTFLRFKARQAD